MNTDATTKLAHQRLSVLELAQRLNNVSEACRQRGISRTIFYEYKRRFDEQGLDGLVDLPPIPKAHPFTTAPAVVERILELSLLHPARGCNFLSDQLRQEGVVVSYPTVQNILTKHGLRTRYDRWLRLETQAAEEHLTPTQEQAEFLEEQNPCWRERSSHVESQRPGQLLCQDTASLGRWAGERLWLHAVVDSYSSFAFALIHTDKQPAAAAAVVHNDVLPFYQQHDLAVSAMLTDNGTEFCGTPEHPFELYLALCAIDHRRTKPASPHTNGFVERFIRTVKEEFFEDVRRRKLYESVDELQTDLDQWLRYYNYERPHQGYRNLGRRPADTLAQFVLPAPEPVKEEA
jgi:transposase InsO family protein